MQRSIEDEIAILKKRQQEIREQLRNLQDEYDNIEVRIQNLEEKRKFW